MKQEGNPASGAHGRGELLREAASAAGHWYLELDDRLVVTYSTEVAQELLAVGGTDLIGRSFVDLTAPEEREYVARILHNSRRCDGTITFTPTLFTSTGERVRLSATVLCRCDQQGAREGVLIVATRCFELDAPLRWKGEARSALETYRQIVDTATDACIIADADTGRVIEANQSAARMLGYERDELLSTLVGDLPIAGLQGLSPPDTEGALDSGDPWSYQGEMRCRDGSTITVESNVRVTTIGSKTFVASSLRDVTEKRRAEAQLRLKDAALESSNSAVIIADLDGLIEYVNSSFASLWGFERPEALRGKTPLDVLSPADDVRELMAHVHEVGSSTRDLVGRKRDGSQFPVAVSASLVTEVRGTPSHVMWWFMDLTERDLAQQALRESQAEIEDQARQLREATALLIHTEKLSALGEMAAGVAHEMNQPLNGIKLTCQALLRDVTRDRLDPQELESDLRSIVGMVTRLSTIIDQMRLFARRPVDSGVGICDVNEAVYGVFKMVGQQLRDHAIDVSMNLGTNLPLAAMDLVKLEQVVMNLVTNARDSLIDCRDIGRRLEVFTGVQERSLAPGLSLVVLEVRDNGSGVTAEAKGRIFEPFFTTKRPGAGTGLGLSIANRLVSEAGGRIEFECGDGGGAVFRVLLPSTTEPLAWGTV